MYRLRKDAKEWQCLTRDHNLLNELIDEQSHNEGREAKSSEYNRTGIAGSLYSITECFVLAVVDSNYPSNEPPESTKQIITVQAGDSFVICSDGIHDLVSSN